MEKVVGGVTDFFSFFDYWKKGTKRGEYSERVLLLPPLLSIHRQNLKMVKLHVFSSH